MATRIRASCEDCGDVELGVEEVRVRVCDSERDGTYLFRCPACSMMVVKAAEGRVVDLLVASGVELTRWRQPAELAEHPDGPAFTHDDLLDFHALLQSEDWFVRLSAVESGGQSEAGAAGD